jgi:hypothetical protein
MKATTVWENKNKLLSLVKQASLLYIFFDK